MCWREKEQELDQGGTQQQQQQGLEENDIPEEAYIGETSKSLVTRVRTHLRDYRQAMAKASTRRGGNTRDRGEAREEVEGEETSSWMADHVLERHGGRASENPQDDFEFHQLQVFLKVLDRQVAESLFIQLAEERGEIKMGPVMQNICKVLMNRKGEFYGFHPRGRQPLLDLPGHRTRPPG